MLGQEYSTCQEATNEMSGRQNPCAPRELNLISMEKVIFKGSHPRVRTRSKCSSAASALFHFFSAGEGQCSGL